jgi:hypothetical protein
MEIRIMSRPAKLLFALIAALMFTSGAVAAEKADSILNARKKAEFDQQAESVRTQMRTGGRYEFVNAHERTVIERRLDQMAAMFERHSDGSDVNDQELVDVLNAQEEINAILTKKDGKRLICTRSAPTGSHRPVNNCISYRDREKSRKASGEFFKDGNPRTHDKSFNGSRE